MFRFILGVAVGMAAAFAIERNRNSARRASIAGGAGGRVDELSTAAEHLPADTETLNVGDGTPTQRSTSGPGAVPSWPASEALDLKPGRAAGQAIESSDTFNAT
jgi:hypothetical protein